VQPDSFLHFFFPPCIYRDSRQWWPRSLSCPQSPLPPPLSRSELLQHCNLVNCPCPWRCSGGIHIVQTNRVIILTRLVQQWLIGSAASRRHWKLNRREGAHKSDKPEEIYFGIHFATHGIESMNSVELSPWEAVPQSRNSPPCLETEHLLP
jgi:hypothetical protein